MPATFLHHHLHFVPPFNLLSCAFDLLCQSFKHLNMASLRQLAFVALSFYFAYPAAAQTETIWASVIVTNYGDRVPLFSPNISVLTPLGALQMFRAGSTFRQRYISPPNDTQDRDYTIAGISQYEIDIRQTSAYASHYPPWVDQSSQAFMSGLYPPLDRSSPNGTDSFPSGALANGSNLGAPLDGQQYPNLYIASTNDPLSIYFNGALNCDSRDLSVKGYFGSDEFKQVRVDSKPFYDSVADLIPREALFGAPLDYTSAFEIWDYLSFESIHNSSFANGINDDTISTARSYADELVDKLYGNVTADDGLDVIAGRTLAAGILNLLEQNIDFDGENFKLTSIVTSFEPLVSFAAILGLPNYRSRFHGMPELAASMAVEIFSTNGNATFPDADDLRVRFLLSDGSTTPDNLDAYPIFGNGNAQRDMSWSDFRVAMERESVGVGNWCTFCGSSAIWCAGATNGTTGLPPGVTVQANGSVGQMRPVVAGAIGAVVTLAVVGLALIGAMLLGGVRFKRERVKPRSELGGFKGSEKLAR